jgi:hypothetical protein
MDLKQSSRWVVFCAALVPLAGACAADDEAAASSGDDQAPPQTGKALESWLEQGAYKKWQCESEVHESRSPSPHSFNRICSNDVIASNVNSTKDWPKGAAAVKELYANADDKEPGGYAVYVKTAADSAGGANWYWYERLPLESAPAGLDNGVVADGMGDEGAAKSICVGCHVAAGTDDAHTPTAHGRDQVYTPVD